jgi:hypothetical protein
MDHPHCPSQACTLPLIGPVTRHIVRAGFYRRRAKPRKVQRFLCKTCGALFSSQTLCPTYRQRRPELNEPIRDMLCSQVSQRRCAKLLNVSRRTVERKFRYLARQAGIANDAYRYRLRQTPLGSVQFDDLITSIHTKCKPVSVSLAVVPGTREILSFEVSNIPARHPLIQISEKRYGKRRDERPLGLRRLFNTLKPIVHPEVLFKSDRDPEYAPQVKNHFPGAAHLRIKSSRARTAGFGELKRIGFDPLFSLNHTCAMLRANLNRLARRTWCTTKTNTGLIFHLELYAHYHNTQLIRRSAI